MMTDSIIRVKCDETVPSCRRCLKTGLTCPGYLRPVKWSTKHEKLSAPSEDYNAEDDTGFGADVDADRQVLSPSSPLFNERAGTFSPMSITSQITSSCATTTTGEDSPASNSSGDQGSSAMGISVASPLQTEAIILSAPNSPPPKQPGDDDHSAEQSNLDEYIGISASDGPPSQDALLSLYIPTEESSVLLCHYYSLICRINSSFDSENNPFRNQMSKLINGSPLLFYCVLSMSAAHLHQYDNNTTISFEYQARALSQLSTDLSTTCILPSQPTPREQESTELSGPSQTTLVKDELLLGIILLGMTSAWNDASSSGYSHLIGSRVLFKSWMSANGLNTANKASAMTDIQRFIVSSMVYWEALSSFVVDQRTEDLAYLDCLANQRWTGTITPSPWTGVATPIFIHLAKVGSLMRKKRALRNISLFRSSEAYRDALYFQLVEDARALEQAILGWRVPFLSLIEDTGDPRAPPKHFWGLARCYRLVAFIELYRAFPEIVENHSGLSIPDGKSVAPDGDYQSPLILSLAFGVLDILKNILSDSSTLPVQGLALIVAGSVLGRVGSPEKATLDQEVMEWREFVRERMVLLHSFVGLRPVKHAAIMIEEAWTRMDALVESNSGFEFDGNMLSDSVHWMDIMIEKRLETILG
ncbi:unnamed protein product [Clonostachys solani]|uniref:Zn(2)-C6 fungal-type domain-containing protein n=1 Tax=Clonostachys solani TaxID=160281 RepID=A0A9P0ELU9_9HYPO|nr:unnamed protein product [Clonostachys solani]